MADTKSEQNWGLQQPQFSPDAGTGSQPTHLDLFSGIGGFALAAKWAGFRTVAFCELDKYCQKVLAKNFPDVPITADVFDLLCALKNNKPLHCETSLFAMRSNSAVESQDSARIAVQPDFFPEALLNEAGNSAHGNAGQSPCAATTARTQAAANGCTAEPTQTGNMGTDIQFVTLSDSLNGEGACSQGIATSASDASSRRKAKGNSTRTTSSRGHNSQSTDLKLITDLLYASHATRGYTVDLLTAGFPCQPFSVAGKQRGKDDDRHLWPSLCEIIGLLRPTFCLLENVPGIVQMELDNVLSDLESIGYSVAPPLVIGAVSVDARHRRQRIWVIGRLVGNSEHTGFDATEVSGSLTQGSNGSATGKKQTSESTRSSEQQSELANASITGLERAGPESREYPTAAGFGTSDCCRWLAEPAVCGMAVRLPEGLHGYWQYPDEWEGVPRVSKGVKDRVSRLKALGNSIQSQVAYELLREIRKLL